MINTSCVSRGVAAACLSPRGWDQQCLQTKVPTGAQGWPCPWSPRCGSIYFGRWRRRPGPAQRALRGCWAEVDRQARGLPQGNLSSHRHQAIFVNLFRYRYGRGGACELCMRHWPLRRNENVASTFPVFLLTIAGCCTLLFSFSWVSDKFGIAWKMSVIFS